MVFDFIFYVWMVLCALLFGTALYRRVKEHGLRYAIFGAPVMSSLGEIDLGSVGRKKMQL